MSNEDPTSTSPKPPPTTLLNEQELADRWKLHRRDCLELAIKLGATSADQAIERAEKLSAYIRIGLSDVKRPPDEAA
jgi:hypothetical protein